MSAAACALFAVSLLAQPPIIEGTPGPDIIATKSIDWLTEQARWENSGGKEGAVSVTSSQARVGQKAIHFRVNVDWYNKAKYPKGWPSFQYRPDRPLDFSGYDAIRFWVRADCAQPSGRPIFRFILHTAGQGRINSPIPGLVWGKWRQVVFDLSNVPDLSKVTLIHFFICESDYKHGDRLHFIVDGFELLRTRRQVSTPPPDGCGLELFIGPGDRAVILDHTLAVLPARVVVYTGSACPILAGASLSWKAVELFTGAVKTAHSPIGHAIPAADKTELSVSIPWKQLQSGPGYYLITCDLLSGDRSLTRGWVGCDDVYVRRPGESMTYTVLSLRLGMAYFVRDLLFGALMGRTRIALPHSLNPLSKRTYLQFIRNFAHWTGKHAEGLEAGLSGLVFSGEALRKLNDSRANLNDFLLRDSIDYIVANMFLDDGSALVHRNDLVDHYSGLIGRKGGPTYWDFRDSNQMGELLRPISRAIIYWHRLGLNNDYCQQLLRPCRRVANFLVRESVQPLAQWNNVMYHYRFRGFGPAMTKRRYFQEGRQCDVYVGRALSGLAYYAYALHLTGHKVPASYISCLRDTVQWAYDKMKKHDGWFDYQCSDEVEGGCHTYLGNMYIAEATFGWYLLADRLGLDRDARLAADATRLAYHYVTDRCYIRGRKFSIPLEFWVGPYLYWELTEYLSELGPDSTFSHWLAEMDRRWTVERKWEDFLIRKEGRGLRTGTNGALEISILGYLGLKLMAQSGQPFSYE